MNNVLSNCCPEDNNMHVFNNGYEMEKNLYFCWWPTHPIAGVGANLNEKSPEKS